MANPMYAPGDSRWREPAGVRAPHGAVGSKRSNEDEVGGSLCVPFLPESLPLPIAGYLGVHHSTHLTYHISLIIHHSSLHPLSHFTHHSPLHISLITSHSSLTTLHYTTGRGWLSILEELRRAWPPLGPRLPVAWQAQYTEPPGRAAARVAAAWAAAAFAWQAQCTVRVAAAGAAAAFAWQAQYTELPGRAAARVAGAVHRASWTS